MNEILLEKFDYAKEQLGIGNYSRVENIAEEFILTKIEKFIQYGYLLKGLLFTDQNFEVEAFECFNKIVTDYPQLEYGYIYRFGSLIRLEKFIEAKSDSNKLLLFDSNNIDYINFQIEVDEYLGDFESVIESCNKILNLYPDEIEFLFTRASAKCQLKRYEQALSDYKLYESSENIDEIDKELTYNDIGYIYIKLGKLSDAKRYLEKAYSEDFPDSLVLNNLGFVLAKLNKVEEGLRLINQSLHLDPLNSYAYKNRAKIFIEIGELSKAEEDLRKAKELDYELLYGDEVNQLLKQIKEKN